MQGLRFNAFLQCNLASCGEVVAMAGGYDVVDDDIDGEAWGTVEVLRPEILFPAPWIIRIPSATPSAVKDPILAAFRLYWVDPSSSANKLRVSVEALLTEFKIPRYNKPRRTKKRMPLSLATRIERYGKKLNGGVTVGPRHPYEKLLHALRWVGNAGSHSGEEVDGEVLLHAFEIYEHVLEQVIEKRPAAMGQIAQALIASKGAKATR